MGKRDNCPHCGCLAVDHHATLTDPQGCREALKLKIGGLRRELKQPAKEDRRWQGKYKSFFDRMCRAIGQKPKQIGSIEAIEMSIDVLHRERDEAESDNKFLAKIVRRVVDFAKQRGLVGSDFATEAADGTWQITDGEIEWLFYRLDELVNPKTDERCWCGRCEIERLETFQARLALARGVSDKEFEKSEDNDRMRLITDLHADVALRHPLGIAEVLYEVIQGIHAGVGGGMDGFADAHRSLDDLIETERKSINLNGETECRHQARLDEEHDDADDHAGEAAGVGSEEVGGSPA